MSASESIKPSTEPKPLRHEWQLALFELFNWPDVKCSWCGVDWSSENTEEACPQRPKNRKSAPLESEG